MDPNNYDYSAGQQDESEAKIFMPSQDESTSIVYSTSDEDAGISDLLPNPGEGGPLPSGSTIGIPNTPIITFPSPGSGSGSGSGTTNYPCNNCGSNNNNNNNNNTNSGSNIGSAILPGLIGALLPRSAKVRFLNAAYGYQAFRVMIGNTRFVSPLNFASVSSYGQVASGFRTVTVLGLDGYVYIQKTLPFQANGITTVAIINTASGLDLLQITDSCCPPTNGYSTFRVGNLAYNSGPMDVLTSDGRVVYSDLRFKEVGAFKRIAPGNYQFFFADTNLSPMPAYQDIETMDSGWIGVYPSYETFGSLFLNVRSGMMYTVYLLQNGSGRNQIQSLILSDS